MSVHTSHKRKIPSRSSKKNNPLWPVMMDDNITVPTHERRKLVETYKNVLPQKRIAVAKVFRVTYSKR